jgi:thymidylate synthase (FAD)
MMYNLFSDGIGSVELIDSMGTDKTAVNAARVSFLRDDTEKDLTEKDKRLIKFLTAHRHTSPFEHMMASFKLTVPLFVRSQIMRHRTFSYNEVSRRYTSENIQLWRPKELRRQSKDNLQCSDGDLRNDKALGIMNISLSVSLQYYKELLASGVSREMARCVLPQATYTEFYMTGNVHNWVKFLKLRTDEHTQPETREAALVIQHMLFKLYPVTMSELFGD